MLILLLATLLALPQSPADPVLETNSFTVLPHRVLRVRRALMLGIELGVNGLTGAGPALSYTFNPSWSVDTAVGVSAQLARAGVRLRYSFLRSAASPFVGIGAMYGLGTPYPLRGLGRDRQFTYRIAGAPLGQAVAGVVYNHRNGFTVLAALGWAQLLTPSSNVIVESGTISSDKLRGIRYAAGSGPVASLTCGYSF